MRIIESVNESCTYNLVLERYLVENFSEETFILWTCNHGIYVGKNQNTFEEIDMEFVEKNNFEVFRRLSGGGTIFHDKNTVYYSFITKNKNNVKDNFIHYNNIIVDFLNNVGVQASLSGRNDVLVDGKKISGSAEYYYKDVLVHHGSLLFDTDIPFLAKALTPNKKKFISKAVNSVKARVDNITNYTELNVEEFKAEIVKYVTNRFNGHKKGVAIVENMQTQKMIEELYGTFEWNYGKSPKYTYIKEDKYVYGIVKVELDIKEGLVHDAKITGDFFSEKEINELEKALIGSKYILKDVRSKLESLEVSKYIVGASVDDLIKLMW
ncbi:lipoate--protein ligase [Mycoplasmatota bacterium WC44]